MPLYPNTWLLCNVAYSLLASRVKDGSGVFSSYPFGLQQAGDSVRINSRALMASLIGIVGLVLVFFPEFSKVQANERLVVAVLLGILATWFASVGNILSVRNSRAGLPVMRTNMVGMLTGAICMALIAMASGEPASIELNPRYLGALLYLAVIGSVVAFGCYLTLINRIGADKGAYAGVAFPIVALLISTWLEDYRWSVPAVIGVVLIVMGNVLVLSKPR